MEIITKKLSELTACPYNPRMITDQALAGLTASVTEYGCVQPVVWNKRTGNVVGGNQRLKVLRAQGDADTEVVVVDLPLGKEKALNVALNSSHISGSWTPALGDLLDEIKLELPDLYEGLLLDDLLADVPEVELEPYVGETDPDEVPEPVIQRGDLVRMGRHRLLVGDSCKAEDVERLMMGKKADMVFADVPYGIDYSGGRSQVVKHKPYGKIVGDDAPDVSRFVRVAFNSGAADIWICCSPVNLAPVLGVFDQHGGVNAIVVWKKPAPGLGYQWIRRYCEFILFQTTRAKPKDADSEFDWWEVATDIENQHGTQKPVELVARAIRFSGGNLVLDPFLGSGTSMIAAHSLGRICYGMEIEPRYVQICVERYLNFTGRPEDVSVEREGKRYKWGELNR